MTAGADLSAYRPNVGVMLIDRGGRIFAGRRAGTADAWQMPQGGIDEGEDVRAAALRELREEVGTDRAAVLAETPDWHAYDLPPDLAGRVWGGRWRGQRQKWVLMRFLGADADIRLDADAHPEFDAWEWLDADALLARIVAFKRPVYEAALAAFRPFLRPLGAARLDHVQVTVPADRIGAAAAFYGGLLALPEIRQPDAQAAAGGAWYDLGGAQLHLKPDATSEDEHRRSKRHAALAVEDLDAAEALLRAAGAEFLPDTRPIPGVRRIFVRDPGGNRLELVQAGPPATARGAAVDIGRP